MVLHEDEERIEKIAYGYAIQVGKGLKTYEEAVAEIESVYRKEMAEKVKERLRVKLGKAPPPVPIITVEKTPKVEIRYTQEEEEQRKIKVERGHRCLANLSSISAFLALGREKFAMARAGIDVDKNIDEALMRLDWIEGLIRRECFFDADYKLIRNKIDKLRDMVAEKKYYEGVEGFSDLADHVVRAMKERIIY